MGVLHRRIASLAAALALLVAGAGAAHAQYFGQNKVQYRLFDWRSLRSDHFEVYFYTGQDSLAMRTLDLAEKTQAEFTARLGHRLSKRIPIILYGSHNDFSQTNVTPELIEGSTGGFTEALRDRVVIPFTGSYEDFRHVLVHELVHAYQFDLFYNNTGLSMLSGAGFFRVPLWFAEGMAEYLSLGMEPNSEMFCRDGMLTGYLPPLEYMGGYLVYKAGQNAIEYLIQRFGEERFREMLQKVRTSRNFERAFQRTYDLSVQKFDEQWREYLRKRYWPTVARHEQPERYGRRLTDHRKDASNANTAPAVSPQGDRIAYFSDRKQYTDVHIMSAFDGRPLRRVIRGEQSVQFEAIPSFRGSLTWSPDGQRLALTAKSAGRDRLYVVDATTGEVLGRHALPADALFYPSWSPVSDSIVVAGVAEGRSDLYVVHARTGEVARLTDDTWDEREPAWSPDGQRIVFGSDRGAPVVLHPLRREAGYGHYGIHELDLATGQSRQILDTAGEDRSPAWSPDGRRLAFITDRNGKPDIFLFDPADASLTQLTDVLGGIASLSWSRQNDRMVFSAFTRGGWDVFSVQEPLSLDPVLDRLRRQSPAAVLSVEEAAKPLPADSAWTRALGALAGTWPDSVSTPDSSAASARDHGRSLPRAGLPPVAFEPQAWEGGELRGTPVVPPPDTVRAAPVLTPLEERGGPFALSDSVLAQSPAPYRWRLSPEMINGGFFAASGYGVIGQTQLYFSDFLGDRSLYIATDVFANSIEETNALAIYSFLPKRWDWSVGGFHFKDYYQSRVTTLGEQLGSAQLFSERSFGALGGVSYPFDRFRRADVQFTQMFVERTFFERDVNGDYFRSGTEYRSVTSPSLSLVGDNSLFGYYGPVNGGRYNLSYSIALPLFDNALSYHTLTADSRRYWDLTAGYTFGVRALSGVSLGRDPQAFRIGGFSTLRGFRDFDLIGSRVALANVELRFPFIQQLGLVGPLPVGIFNIRGALFSDVGLVWNEGDALRLSEVEAGKRRLASPRMSFGTGIRTYLLGLPIKLDAAWPTDLAQVGKPRWHFSIGYDF